MDASTEAKRAALRKQGHLHSRPQDVRDPLFQTREFFDPHDLLQVKYEMVRRVRLEGYCIHAAASLFGFSRPAFYQAQAAYEHHGLPGLLRRRPGPRRASKLTAEIEAFLRQQRDSTTSSSTLSAQVRTLFGRNIHPRSIERALTRWGKKTAVCRRRAPTQISWVATNPGPSATKISAAKS